MIKIHKLASYLLIGTLVFTGREVIAFATVDTVTGSDIISTEEPIAGINLALEELYQTSDNAEQEITQYLEKNCSTEFDNIGFAQVTDYVNIRSKASENGEILGKLYNDSAATILSTKDGWHQIKSGSVKGYIKAEFLVTGEDAEKIAKSVGSRIATVTTTTLKVREKASLDSEVLMLVPEGEELKVVKEQENWEKISLGDNKIGYVSDEYVTIQTVYEEAVSIEEEQERLEEEAAANEEETTSSSSNSSSTNSSNGSKTESNNTVSNDTSNDSNSSDLGRKIASYALQFKGNPYVWGGTSLTNGADCSGFTQSVFAHFGISIPRTSRTQATGGARVSLDNLKAGDLLFYTNGGTINHVALYIGNGQVIGASSPATGIRISRYNYRQPYKAVRYIN